MAIAIEQPEVIRNMKEAMATLPVARAAAITPRGEAIESKPLVGAEITIKLSLSPGMITLIAAPLTVLVTMLVGWVLLTSAGLPTHVPEMIGGAIANVVGGIAASLPLFILMKRGAAAIAQAGILGISLRIGTVLMVMLLAGATPWGLERPILAYWVLGFYAPMFIVETAVIAWLSQKAKF